MNREEAAEALGISVRSLQRAVRAGRLSVRYRRGVSGKQEAVFDEGDVTKLKTAMESETVKPALVPHVPQGEGLMLATMRDTDLARSVALVARESVAAVLEAVKPDSSVPVADKIMLTLAEASALTNLSRNHLRQAIEDKKLKARIIGRGWRVKREDLDAYVKKL